MDETSTFEELKIKSGHILGTEMKIYLPPEEILEAQIKEGRNCCDEPECEIK